jgi:hypothetical protein
MSLRTFVHGLALLAAACGGDDGGGDDDGSGGGNSSPGVGRGSAACQDWQDAICDFVADECGAVVRDLCDDNYRGVECLSDEQASECANALQQATCTSPPPSCDLTDVADPAPAVAKCEGILEAICELVMRCGSSQTLEDCIASTTAMLSFDCATAIAVDLRYESCIEAIQQATCDRPPPMGACTGVIRAIQ